MTTTTADHFALFADPSESFEFKAFILLDSIIVRIKLRGLIELTRLSFLGFYDRFEKFLSQIQYIEDDTVGEEAMKAVLSQRLRLAQNVERLVARLEPMTHVPFKDSNLGEYIAGKDRIDVLKFFIKNTRFEHEAEELIEHSKIQFLSRFARRKLTREQKNLLVEKYRKISIGQ
jgi:hypothetical protein